MKRVLVPLAEGFEEIEAVTVIDLLRRADIQVVTAALAASPVRGSHGIAVVADRLFAEIEHETFDLVALPGGMPGTRHLREDPRVIALLRRHAFTGAWVTAICAAPSVLGAAGLLDDKRATSFPGFLDAATIRGLQPLDDAVVVDGKVITSRGPGTAIDFGLALVEQLAGRAARDAVESRLQRPPAAHA